jgi:predicted nucleic acid-binding protein
VASEDLAYLDASAFLKIAVQESGYETLLATLDRWVLWVSSALLEVEAIITARRRHPRAADLARALLQTVDLVEIDAGIRHAAADLADPGLRSLDAIHLATALSLGERCGTIFSYDDRLITAARAHGLTVSVPRP